MRPPRESWRLTVEALQKVQAAVEVLASERGGDVATFLQEPPGHYPARVAAILTVWLGWPPYAGVTHWRAWRRPAGDAS